MSFVLKPVEYGNGMYRIVSDNFVNRYYSISTLETCKLMASPEVVGFHSYKAMLEGTLKGLRMLGFGSPESAPTDHVSILTILRGGLNYPLEEACCTLGVRVPTMNFLSCERIISNGVITGLDIKYEKLRAEQDVTLMIGDIIASGETLTYAMRYFVNWYREHGGSLRRIIFFTIGGTRAITLMEELTPYIHTIWPQFEGFDCIFYEGMFTVYTDNGVTGVNIPYIDFGWKGGVVTPEFRKYIFDYKYAPALLEKCIIYDGGARRYEIPAHYEEVTDYWKRLFEAAVNGSTTAQLVQEKLGCGTVSFSEWLNLNHYESDASLIGLYSQEQVYASGLSAIPLEEICKARLEQLEKDLGIYK